MKSDDAVAIRPKPDRATLDVEFQKFNESILAMKEQLVLFTIESWLILCFSLEFANL